MLGKLSEASVAFLWDHQVGGRALFPAAAMLEATAAAAVSMCGNDAGSAAAMLTHASIPVPLPLPTSPALASDMAVTVDLRTARLQLETESGGYDKRTHLRCLLTQASKSSEIAPCSGPSGGYTAILSSLQQLGEFAVQPSAFGSVMQRKVLQAEEFLTDPAVIDNGTQVSKFRSWAGYSYRASCIRSLLQTDMSPHFDSLSMAS